MRLDWKICVVELKWLLNGQRFHLKQNLCRACILLGTELQQWTSNSNTNNDHLVEVVGY